MTPASPPPPGSGSFTLTPRQAQSDATGEPKRDQEEGAGPSDGTRSGIISLHTSIYLFVSRTCGPPLNRSTGLAPLGTRARLAPVG